MSPREARLLLATLTVALFGGTALLGRSSLDEWKALRKEQGDLELKIKQERTLVEARDQWVAEFAELSRRLPVFPAEKKMDIHWLSLAEGLARNHGLRISRRQAGDEEQVGDLYELPIEAKEWEGSLDALVHFLYDLEKEGSMLDIRQLYVKPKSKDVLRGRFLLYCAYSRQGEAEDG